MRYAIFFSILWLFASNNGLIAQSDSLGIFAPGSSPSLQATLKRSGQDIVLRWAPANEGLWLNSLEGFVQIERLEFSSFKDFSPDRFERIVEELRPWSIAEFEQALATNPENDYLVMAGQSLYGEWETVDSSTTLDMSTIIRRQEELRNKYSTAMLVADLDAQAATAMGIRYVDRDVVQDKYLLYRISLYVPAYGIFESATALYNPHFNLKATPKIDAVEGLDGSIRLSWEREGHERYFTAYFIERSLDGKQFERMNRLPYINAVDEKEAFGVPPITYLAEAENGIPYYYRIIGIDAFGELSEPSPAVQVAAKDLTPPSAPTPVGAETDGQAAMRIFWECEASDAVAHFVVRRGQRAEGPFVVISPLLPAGQLQFEDSGYDPVYANFYEVCAIDKEGNEACSMPFYGQVKDQVGPAVPSSLTGYIDTSGVVVLRWPLGPDPDLAGYHVFVANGPDQVFTRINSQLVRDTTFRDTIPLNTLTEEIFYCLAAVDVRSNVSSFSEMLRLVKPDTIPPTSALFEWYEVRDSSIWLRWVNSNSRDVVRHELHRRKDDGEWTLIQTFTGLEVEFVDVDLAPATDYEYQITAVDDAGLRSQVVRTLKVATPRVSGGGRPGLSAEADGQAIRLQFQLAEPQREIARVVVYKAVNEGAFRHFSTLLDSYALELTDRDCQSGNKYAYKYRVFYRDGMKSAFSNDAEVAF